MDLCENVSEILKISTLHNNKDKFLIGQLRKARIISLKNPITSNYPPAPQSIKTPIPNLQVLSKVSLFE